MDTAKVIARRALDGPEPTPSGWTLACLEQVGEQDFNQVMLRASFGDPHDTSTSESAEADFRELVEAAGGQFDPRGWYLVRDDRGDIGVVLPQVFPDEPTTGTLFYVAVVPERRGEGLGRALHRFGLSELARRAAKTYVGSTDAANEPMIAVFTANGCSVS